MQLLHVIESLDPADGGPPVVATRLAAAQASLGHDVHILCYQTPDAEPRIEAMLKACPGGASLTVHHVSGGSRIARLFPSRIDQIIKGVGKVEFVHLHGIWGTLLLKTSRIARKHQIPYAVVAHGMLDPWSLSQRRMKKRIALVLGYRSMLNHAAFLHALNQDEAKLVEPLSLRCPVEVIPNGIFPQEFENLPPRGTFRSLHPQLGDHPYVLFLSRLHYKKGLDILAEGFVGVAVTDPQAHLVVAGPDDGALDDFQQRIRSAGLEQRVHIVGAVYDQQKLAALVESACFCLPSRQEGFSIAITEAMACSVPVVVSEACHFPEIREVNAGRIVPLNAISVAQALHAILSDPTQAAAMGRNGRQLVMDHFTWPRIAQSTIDAYNRAQQS